MPIRVEPFVNPFKKPVKDKNGDTIITYNGKQYKKVSRRK